MNYYMAQGTTQKGPLPPEELAQAGVAPDTLVWCEGMSEWQRADSVPALRVIFGAPPTRHSGAGAFQAQTQGMQPASPMQYATPPLYGAPPYSPGMSSNKIAAGICGIFLGTFGVHKFILGLTGGAVTMLCVSLGCILVTFLTCGVGGFIAMPVVAIMHIIGLVEGIIYLAKSDEAFYNQYVVQRRQWF